MSTFEEGLLGCLLSSPEKIKEIKDIVLGRDIEDEFIRETYLAMVELESKGEPIDLITISNLMQPKRTNENVHGSLILFAQDNSMKADVVHYARKVVEARKYRDLGMIAMMIQSYVAERQPLPTILNYMHNIAEEMYKGVSLPHGVEMWEIWQHIQEEKDAILWKEKKSLKLLTHFSELDRLLEGLRPGNLVTIAARSGGGKTTFGLNLLKRFAIFGKVSVMALSLEMSEEEVGYSVLASLTKTSQTLLKSEVEADLERSIDVANAGMVNFRSGKVEFKVYCNSVDKLGGAISTIICHVKAYPQCKVVMIDYVGLLSIDDNQAGKNLLRTYEIGKMTRAFKALAQQLQIVILLLAQTNRDKEEDDNTPLNLSDLRDSASLGHDANVVLMLQPVPGGSQIKVIVAKNRNGATGIVRLGYDKETANFIGLLSADDQYNNYDYNSVLEENKKMMEQKSDDAA